MSYSEEISRFVGALRWEDVPAHVVDSAKRHLLDVVGVGLAGSCQEMTRRAAAAVRSIPGSVGAACIWGVEVTLASPYAAMVNGMAAHVLDFDDTHTDSITHGSAVLGPTVLALGEELGACGRDTILAFIAGWELTARVGLAARGSFHRRGFHTTSIAGVFGATAAASKLLGLSEEQTTHALGLAGSQVSGVSEYLSNGSSPKSFHPGWAAHAGIIAAHLARSGMTGPLTVFEGRYGLLTTYGILEQSDLAQLTRELGARWETARISIKPYPCCHFAHAFIDCALNLRRRGLRPDDLSELECVVPEIELPLICEPYAQKLNPESPYAARFSLPYLVAAALTDGTVGHETFTPESIRRPDVLALARRVTYRVAAPGETTFPTYFPGRIQVRRKDGSSLDERLDINWGNPDSPLPLDAIKNKFRANASGVLSDAQVDAVLLALTQLEDRSVADVLQPLGTSSRCTPAPNERDVSRPAA